MRHAASVVVALCLAMVLAHPASSAGQEEDAQPFAFYDVTDDMGAFTASRYFPVGAHPLHEDSGILYLTARDLIERYSLHLDELEAGQWAGGQIDFRLVGLLVRPMSLISVSYLFKDKLVQAMVSHAARAEKEFRYFGHDGTRPLTTAEQVEFLELAADWTREAASCISHMAAGTEPDPAVLLDPEDCSFLKEWGGLLLQEQEDPEKTMNTAAGLLAKLAGDLDAAAASLAAQ